MRHPDGGCREHADLAIPILDFGLDPVRHQEAQRHVDQVRAGDEAEQDRHEQHAPITSWPDQRSVGRDPPEERHNANAGPERRRGKGHGGRDLEPADPADGGGPDIEIMIIAGDPVTGEEGIGKGDALACNLFDHCCMLDHVEDDEALVKPPATTEIHHGPGADQPPGQRNHQEPARAAPAPHGLPLIESAQRKRTVQQQHARQTGHANSNCIENRQNGQRQEHRPTSARPECLRAQPRRRQQSQQPETRGREQDRRDQCRAHQTAKILNQIGHAHSRPARDLAVLG